MRQIKFILFLSLILGFVSCDLGEEPEIGGVEIQEMTGEWWVTFTVNGDDIYGLGYTLITTYNTAANSTNEMFIDDLQNTWGYKLRTPIDFAGRSFSGADLAELYFDVTATITNGNMTYGGTETSGGNITDGVSFDVEFSDDPGTTYHVEGYRRTGFQEDEH